MRNVLKSGEVFHFFANETQQSGRCGNISFDLPDAYSYRAIIGRHFAQGVAISSVRHSVTTSGHQSDLRQACSHLVTVSVPYPASVLDSFDVVNVRVKELLRKASTARLKRDLYIADAIGQIEAFNTFSDWAGNSLRIERPALDDAAMAAIAESVKVENARMLALKKERERLVNLQNAEKLAEWRKGSNVRLYHDAPMMLRIVGDTIETSKWARIPVAEAPLIWAMVQRKKEWKPGSPIGPYQLTKVRKDGSIVVGCHDIPYSELELIAKQLGYVGEAMPAESTNG